MDAHAEKRKKVLTKLKARGKELTKAVLAAEVKLADVEKAKEREEEEERARDAAEDCAGDGGGGGNLDDLLTASSKLDVDVPDPAGESEEEEWSDSEEAVEVNPRSRTFKHTKVQKAPLHFKLQADRVTSDLGVKADEIL